MIFSKTLQEPIWFPFDNRDKCNCILVCGKQLFEMKVLSGGALNNQGNCREIKQPRNSSR